MVTMGLTLRVEDFRDVAARPRDVTAGLGGQIVLLPLVAFAIVLALRPPPAIAIGLVILACCPGGATSNFFSFLARGDLALSVVLTTLSGCIVIFTLPPIVNLALDWFAGESQAVRLPVLRTMARIFMLVVLPTIAGMLVRRYYARLAARIEPAATRLSFAAILLTMVALFDYVSEQFVSLVALAWKEVVLLNVVMMAAGFAGGRAIGVGERARRSIAVEIGVQNYLLSVVIAIALLGKPEYTVVPIVYLFWMYVSVFCFIGYCRYWRDRGAVPSPAMAGEAKANAEN